MFEIVDVPDGEFSVDIGVPSPQSFTALERRMAALVVARSQEPTEERLRTHPTGATLLTQLERLDIDQLGEAALEETVAAARRIASVAQQIEMRAAATLASRESMNPGALAQRTTGPATVAGDCLALRLRCSKREAHSLIERGWALATYLTRTNDALATGQIDNARAAAIADGLRHVPWQVAIAVEDRVIERAPNRTAVQVRADVAAALIAVDPVEAQARAQARRRERRVSRPRAHPDGVASLRVEGPAPDVLALDIALDSAARAAKARGDARTLDQLRFDTLTGLGHHALATGAFTIRGQSSGELSTRDQRTGEHSTRRNNRGKSAPGRGGFSAPPCTDTTVPLATINGHRPRIQVTIALDQLLPDRSDDAELTETASSAGGPTGHEEPDVSGPVSKPGPAEVPIAQVPVLDGYGPIAPATARALAAGGIWRRLVTDPLTGAPVDVGTTRYRPPAAMARRIRARDRTCVRPGCTHRAEESPLDHTVPYSARGDGGTTGDHNLGALCTRDHLIKTHGDFAVSQPEPGIFNWTTPSGHRYRRERDGTTTDRGFERPSMPGYGSRTDEEPPF
ncbi:HNH endonuclease signature motif containing protein [Ruania halotolerans]|uniref:HNH endonuclease signature motif containing protein n=1 Tax=Ruania halotolerans TaxID=2897773 RepID=UPI001E43B0B8|nr:HNH endonuclease signature motif containing protein [Ruania halotolerans]UFU07813.1 HNH endonuclease [Ruania halotolerans]